MSSVKKRKQGNLVNFILRINTLKRPQVLFFLLVHLSSFLDKVGMNMNGCTIIVMVDDGSSAVYMAVSQREAVRRQYYSYKLFFILFFFLTSPFRRISGTPCLPVDIVRQRDH